MWSKFRETREEWELHDDRSAFTVLFTEGFQYGLAGAVIGLAQSSWTDTWKSPGVVDTTEATRRNIMRTSGLFAVTGGVYFGSLQFFKNTLGVNEILSNLAAAASGGAALSLASRQNKPGGIFWLVMSFYGLFDPWLHNEKIFNSYPDFYQRKALEDKKRIMAVPPAKQTKVDVPNL